MPRRDIPGVEEGNGASSIQKLSTSITGFIGLAKIGPVNEPKLVQNYEAFVELFGDFWESAQLAYSVLGFFQNGGGKCYIVRINETEDVSAITDSDFIGNKEVKTGLYAIDSIAELNLIVIPDAQGAPEVIKAGLEYCATRKNCFFIADIPPGMYLELALGFMTENNFSSSHGAIYYPNIYVEDSLTGENKLICPSGHMAGYYARNDYQRGVWKAPTNIGTLEGALEVEFDLTTDDQEDLRPKGVNCIRKFADKGIIPWGGRTFSLEYIHIRRMLEYTEQCIFEGTKWVIFEPNDESLWIKLKEAILNFLTEIWREGGLQGAKIEHALFIKCDSETNTPEQIEAGKVNVKVGLALLKPAEFLTLDITHHTGDRPSNE